MVKTYVIAMRYPPMPSSLTPTGIVRIVKPTVYFMIEQKAAKVEMPISSPFLSMPS